MAEPTSQQEYEQTFNANQRLSGSGLDTTVHLPCPFCAAPDFMIYKIIEADTAMADGATCVQCSRSAALELSVNTPSNKQFEIVQTGGPDQPSWLQPQMRRK